MKTNNILGIIFANSHDALLRELTETRSMASVPFGARYRLVDFMLSNLTNAGVSKVGLVTKANYFSLMSHLGNGKPWDLDRKIGGLSIYPPYSSGDAQVYKGRVEALYGIMECLLESEEEYVILCDTDVIANIDLRDVMNGHIENDADITVVYANGKKPKGQNDVMSFRFDKKGRITEVAFEDKDDCDYGLDVIILRRELLIDLVNEAYSNGLVSFSHGIIDAKYKELKVYGYCHKGYVAVMDGVPSYFEANKALLNADVRRDLFNPERPIYTNSKDDMPAKYGIESVVSNSLIADGCIIDGEVKNCILFRDVIVAAGAVVENSILMEGTTIGAGCELNYMITDRFATVTEDKKLDGRQTKRIIGKKETV